MSTEVAQGSNEPRHGLRIFVIWAILSAIAVPLIIFLLGPHLPPGHETAQASDQTNANTVLTAMVAPVVIFVWVFFGYSLVSFRLRGKQIEDGPPIKGNSRIQLTWILTTSAIVLFLAGWGTYVLLGPSHGAGGGQGPAPLAVPPGDPLQVQVIGQQWEFTFRYPSYGGVETTSLVLPANRTIELHVTSTDVIHSFWAYQLGVKADANPSVDNIAYVQTKGPGAFTYRCSELCGLWHGQMFGTGSVVSDAAFATWIRGQQLYFAPLHQYLPPYERTYNPGPIGRAG